MVRLLRHEGEAGFGFLARLAGLDPAADAIRKFAKDDAVGSDLRLDLMRCREQADPLDQVHRNPVRLQPLDDLAVGVAQTLAQHPQQGQDDGIGRVERRQELLPADRHGRNVGQRAGRRRSRAVADDSHLAKDLTAVEDSKHGFTVANAAGHLNRAFVNNVQVVAGVAFAIDRFAGGKGPLLHLRFPYARTPATTRSARRG